MDSIRQSSQHSNFVIFPPASIAAPTTTTTKTTTYTYDFWVSIVIKEAGSAKRRLYVHAELCIGTFSYLVKS